MRIVIIGGGISGLAVANRLVELQDGRSPSSITLLEASERLGGVIETVRKDRLLFEGGPDAFLSEKPWALELCRRLGLAEAIQETQPAYRRSFVVRHGRLVMVPEGWYLVAPARLGALWRTPLVSWRAKLRMACEPWIPPRRSDGDESVGSFIRRRLGREALERIGQPMIGGIYTADPERLSLQATFPQLLEWERRDGGILRGLRRMSRQRALQASGPRYSLFLSLRDGLGSLPNALAQRLQPSVTLRTNARVAQLMPGTPWRIRLSSGELLEADAVCVAAPAPEAARMLRGADDTLASQLDAIAYASVATVNLAFPAAALPPGAGCVVPAIERRRIIGLTFVTQKFAGRAPEDVIIVRAFLGGAGQQEMLAQPDDRLIALVRQELRELLQIDGEPLASSIRRYPAAMPQYAVGHVARIQAIEQRVREAPGLHLTGNAYHGIGIPDCIRHAEQTAERMLSTRGSS